MIIGVQGACLRMRVMGMLFVLLLCWGGAVHAKPPGGSNDVAKSVQLNVHGRISEHCAMGHIDDVDFGDLTRSGLRVAMRVQLSCNGPFNMSIKAANGGLANLQYPRGQGPYAGTLPYIMGVTIPIRKPDSGVVDRSFTSLELLGGQTFSSQGGIALDGMEMFISLGPPPSEAGLLGGDYGETIIITVAPS